MTEGIKSHVVFTVKHSRYDWQRIKRRKPAGYIAPTFPFFENEAEEVLIEILCDVGIDLQLNIAAFIFCGDHVHALLVSKDQDISKIIGQWKGKSAYLFNQRVRTSNQTPESGNHVPGVQNLWAKSYYQKIITSPAENKSVIEYVKNNRQKHGLKPLTKISLKKITTLLENNLV